MGKGRLAGHKSRHVEPRVPVYMTQPQWTAMAAVLTTSLSIIESQAVGTQVQTLLREVMTQVDGIELHPITVREGPDVPPSLAALPR